MSSDDLRITLGSSALLVAIGVTAIVVIVRNARSAATRRLTIVFGALFIVFQVAMTVFLSLYAGIWRAADVQPQALTGIHQAFAKPS